MSGGEARFGPAPGGREPLVGFPERVLAGARAALTWLGLAAALGLPIAVLPRLAPWAQENVGSWHLRVVLGVCLYGGLAVLVHRLVGTLVERLHAGRTYELMKEGLSVGMTRIWGSPLSRRGGPNGPSIMIPWTQVRQVFTRKVPWGRAVATGVGLWYVGEDGRGREIWLLLEESEGEGLARDLAAATGLAETREGRVP